MSNSIKDAPFLETMFEAFRLLDNEGILVSVAAGNNGKIHDPRAGGTTIVNQPGFYNTVFKNIINVGNVDPEGILVPSSDWGLGVDILAPGVQVCSFSSIKF